VSTATTSTIGTREAAEILDVHPNTVRRLERAGILPAVRTTPLPRSPRRFRREDVEAVRERTLAATVLAQALDEVAA
jgi:excisionase family DNA binding protein